MSAPVHSGRASGRRKAVIFCIIVVIISLIQLKATRSKEVQQ